MMQLQSPGRLVRYSLHVCARVIMVDIGRQDGETMALTGTAELTLEQAFCPHQRPSQLQASCIEPGLEWQRATVSPLLMRQSSRRCLCCESQTC